MIICVNDASDGIIEYLQYVLWHSVGRHSVHKVKSLLLYKERGTFGRRVKKCYTALLKTDILCIKD
jgi:hypothetical protein